MKIYRFIPNTSDFGILSRPVVQRWWPQAIDLGWEMNMLFAGAEESVETKPKNYYHDANGLPLSDFPALSLNLPIISEKAATVLQQTGLSLELEPITVNNKPYYAVQPVDVPGSLDWQKSQGLQLANGEIYYMYSRAFNETELTKTSAEFFTIADYSCSDIYITEKLLAVCQQAQLTGLEYVELVFDGEPCVPRYTSIESSELKKFTLRAQMERELIEWRCASFHSLPDTVQQAVADAACNGYISFEDSH